VSNSDFGMQRLIGKQEKGGIWNCNTC